MHFFNDKELFFFYFYLGQTSINVSIYKHPFKISIGRLPF